MGNHNEERGKVNEELLQAALRCGGCEIMEGFARVDDDGEANVDLALRNAEVAGWEVIYTGRDGYRIRCIECVEWEKEQR